jgi:hypothetical protein
MAYEVLDTALFGNLLAGADLSTHQFKFVQAELKSGALKVVLAATAGQRVLGVLQDKPTADGNPCVVAGAGISKAVAGGPMLPGEYIATTNAGLAVTTSTTAHERVGMALEQATASGQIVACLVRNFGKNVP